MSYTESSFMGYIPIDPIPAKNVDVYNSVSGKFESLPWASLSDSIIRELLPNQSAQVSLKKFEVDGKISFMVASVTEEASSYEVIMDFMKYRVENVSTTSNDYGSARVGIGLRIRANVKTNKAGLNLSGLTNLAVEASLKNLTGFISVDIIGIDSKDVTNYIPLTAKLDETSIQSALQALATIKSKIWDKDVNLTPQLLAYNQKEDNAGDMIKKSITETTFENSDTGDIIRSFWKPDSENINSKNDKILRDLLEKNGQPNEPGRITQLIVSKKYSDLRKKVLIDLISMSNGSN